ncbi:mcfQ [Symbiodinium pilosum]|uniref:McfQ protein n=1 Tax=Symbiodinium pilosum TaxID=2952 RepID=A0A812V383_SYMPI|nr:mcfQ [Symbiodinium pilosum]
MTSINPMEVLSTKLQVGSAARGPLDQLRLVISQDGLAGLFKGYWFNLILCSNPAIQNTIFDKIQEAMLLRKKQRAASAKVSLTSLEVFMLGALAKAIATMITFPVTRIKTMLQAGEPPIPEEEREHNDDEKTQAPQILRNLSFSHKALEGQRPRERLCELYRGLRPTLMKGVLQAALMYLAKDQVTKIVVACLRAVAKKRRLVAN